VIGVSEKIPTKSDIAGQSDQIGISMNGKLACYCTDWESVINTVIDNKDT
jgi:hypothetical protein